MQSSEVRSKLSKVLHQVFTEGEDIQISHNSVVIGILTTKAPVSGIKPMRVKIDEIRPAWNGHLELMTCLGARFVFHRRFKVGDEESDDEAIKPGKVYLLPKYRNPVLTRWKTHIEQGLTDKGNTGFQALHTATKKDVQTELEEIQQLCTRLAGKLTAFDERVEMAFDQLDDNSDGPDESAQH